MKKNLPTSNALLAAIRAKCMDCSGNARSLVERCNIHNCPFIHIVPRGLLGRKNKAKKLPGKLDSLI